MAGRCQASCLPSEPSVGSFCPGQRHCFGGRCFRAGCWTWSRAQGGPCPRGLAARKAAERGAGRECGKGEEQRVGAGRDSGAETRRPRSPSGGTGRGHSTCRRLGALSWRTERRGGKGTRQGIEGPDPGHQARTRRQRGLLKWSEPQGTRGQASRRRRSPGVPPLGSGPRAKASSSGWPP